jgi:hypothetical protein
MRSQFGRGQLKLRIGRYLATSKGPPGRELQGNPHRDAGRATIALSSPMLPK